MIRKKVKNQKKDEKIEKIEIFFRYSYSQNVYDAFLEKFCVKKVRKVKLSELKKKIREYSKDKIDQKRLFEDLKLNRKFLGILKKAPSVNKFVSFLNEIEFRIDQPGADLLQDLLEQYERKRFCKILFNPIEKKWFFRKLKDLKSSLIF